MNFAILLVCLVPILPLCVDAVPRISAFSVTVVCQFPQAVL